MCSTRADRRGGQSGCRLIEATACSTKLVPSIDRPLFQQTMREWAEQRSCGDRPDGGIAMSASAEQVLRRGHARWALTHRCVRYGSTPTRGCLTAMQELEIPVRGERQIGGWRVRFAVLLNLWERAVGCDVKTQIVYCKRSGRYSAPTIRSDYSLVEHAQDATAGRGAGVRPDSMR